MKKQPTFKDYCEEMLGATEESKLISSFYKSLKTPPHHIEDKVLTATQRKERSLKYLLDNFDKEIIIEAIHELQKQKDAGILKADTLYYFSKFVAVFAQNKSMLFSSEPKSEIPYVIPLQSRKWTDII